MLANKAGVLSVESMQDMATAANKVRTEFLELKKKAASGDASAQQYFALRELELGHVTYADYRKRNPDLQKLSENVRESVRMIAGEFVLKQAQKTLRAAGRDEEKVKAALAVVGESLLAASKEGAEPYDDEQRVAFYYYLGVAGDKHSRADMLDVAVAGLVDDAEDNKALAESLAKWKAKSADLGAALRAKKADKSKPAPK